jgi:hypothetical protein
MERIRFSFLLLLLIVFLTSGDVQNVKEFQHEIVLPTIPTINFSLPFPIPVVPAQVSNYKFNFTSSVFTDQFKNIVGLFSTGPSKDYPSDTFDIKGWVAYLYFLIIIFVLPIILCCCCCCSMTCYYCTRWFVFLNF